MSNPTIRPANEIQRLRVLKEYRVIDTPPEERFDDLTRLASQICEVPIALISLVESHRQWVKSKIGVMVQESLRNGAFCAHTILQSDLFIVPDALDDIRFVDNPFVIHPPNIRFYAGAPLQNSEGYTLGSLCVLDFVPRELTEQQKDALRVLSRQVVAQLELRRLTLQQKHSRTPSLSPSDEYEGNVRLLMESTGEGIYGLDLEGNCTFCNPACLRMLGYDAREELYGKNMHALIHHTNQDGSDSPIEECKVNQSFQTGLEIHGDDEILWRKDGTSFQAEYWSYPVRVEGNIVGSVVTFVDITERKQADKNLKASEMYFRTLVENAPFCIHELDLEGRFLSVNPAGLRMVNLKKEEQLIGTSYLDGVASEDRTRVQALLLDACEGRSAEFEFKSAREHPPKIFASNFIPIRDSEKRIVSIMGFTQDITKHKQVEEIILQSRDFYLTLLENFPAFIWRAGLDAKCNYLNKTWLTFTGRSLEEELGDGWTESVHPEDRDRCLSTYLKAFESKQAFEMEYRLRRYDGEYRWVVDVGNPFRDLEDKFAGYIGSCYDISDRKQAEAELEQQRKFLRHVIDMIPNFVFAKDREGRFTLVNQEVAKAYGTTVEELLGKSDADFNPNSEEVEFFRQKDLMVFDSLKDEFIPEEVITDSKGEQRWLQTVKRPLMIGEDGKAHYVLGVATDITARKQMEQALREKDRALQQAQKMEIIGTLAGGIAHDFNNILSGIFGFTEMALKTIPENEQLHTYLEQVLIAASRAKDLVKQILAFSRNIEIERRPTDPHLLLKEVLNFLRATLPSSIEIKEHLAENVSSINADPTQIYQVIINLCTNAEFAMRETGGVLEIRLEMVEVNQELHDMHPQLTLGSPYLCLSVQDSGKGMSLDVQNRIFDPFFTTKAVGEGAGMGLSVVHGIIASHGGAITLHSQIGHGTTFKIYLPKINSEVIPSVQEDIQIETGRGNVLLVEDEESLAGLGKLMIEQLGYTVEVHTSSLNALASFKRSPQKFDVVMSDQTMPTLTGEGLARKLLEVRVDLPIILCTGYSHTMTPEKAKAMGIRAFLMKPFQMRELATILQKVLRNHSQQPE